jgi:hypothetical protein
LLVNLNILTKKEKPRVKSSSIYSMAQSSSSSGKSCFKGSQSDDRVNRTRGKDLSGSGRRSSHEDRRELGAIAVGMAGGGAGIRGSLTETVKSEVSDATE